MTYNETRGGHGMGNAVAACSKLAAYSSNGLLDGPHKGAQSQLGGGEVHLV